MADRDDWEKATVQQRHLAVAADAELRRRHPDEHYPPLRLAEPEPATSDQCQELTITAAEQTREAGQWIKGLAAAHRSFADRLADRQSLRIPSQDPDYGDLARRSRLGQDEVATRSCSLPSRRSGRPRRSSSARRAVPPISRPQINGHRVEPDLTVAHRAFAGQPEAIAKSLYHISATLRYHGSW
jgi:hypothetical protein